MNINMKRNNWHQIKSSWAMACVSYAWHGYLSCQMLEILTTLNLANRTCSTEIWLEMSYNITRNIRFEFLFDFLCRRAIGINAFIRFRSFFLFDYWFWWSAMQKKTFLIYFCKKKCAKVHKRWILNMSWHFRLFLTYDFDVLSIECDCFLTSCCDACGVGVLRMVLTTGTVIGALTGSTGLIGLIVFFMINSSVSPANLWPILGNLFTILCVNDVDGRLLRVDCAEREDGKSNAPKDVFNDEATATDADTDEDDDDADDPDPDADADNDEAVNGPAESGANADGFVRLLSNDSLPP